ncbi:MAG: hypothetical protein WC756_08010 [Taibaiella sp.]|jgi:hypothetical protein
MNIKEQKEILIEKIRNEEDENMLSSVYHLLERDFAVSEAETIYLTHKQKEGVKEGLENIKTGKVYTDEEAKRMIDKMLRDETLD